MARRSFAAGRPFGAHLELTYACNWRCVFCYNPRHHDLQRMDAAQWRAVLDALRELGTLQVTLTGGEPLAHPEFWAIARSVREHAFVLRVFTNGALIGSDEADRMAALTPLAVEMSLHGADAATHDQATAKPGSFVAMWRAIDLLQARGVRVVLKTPVTRLNEGQLDGMVDLVREHGLPHRLDPALTPRDDGDRSPLAFVASAAALRKVYDLGVARGELAPVTRRDGEANCGLARATVTIDPEGNVHPCMQWRHSSLGNVRKAPLHEIWRGSTERKRLATLAVEVNDRLLEHDASRVAAPFCPALAEQRTGDPFQSDESYLASSALLLAAHRRQP